MINIQGKWREESFNSDNSEENYNMGFLSPKLVYGIKIIEGEKYGIVVYTVEGEKVGEFKFHTSGKKPLQYIWFTPDLTRALIYSGGNDTYIVDCDNFKNWLDDNWCLFKPTTGKIVRDGDVREYAISDAKILDRVKKGTILDVLEESGVQAKYNESEAFWYKVRTANEREGWIHGSFIDVDIQKQTITPVPLALESVKAGGYLSQGKNDYSYHFIKAIDNNPDSAWITHDQIKMDIADYAIKLTTEITVDKIILSPVKLSNQKLVSTNYIKEMTLNYQKDYNFKYTANTVEITFKEDFTDDEFRFRVKKLLPGFEKDKLGYSEIELYYKGKRISFPYGSNQQFFKSSLIVKTLSASSTLTEPNDKNAYHPIKAFDNNPKTMWLVGSSASCSPQATRDRSRQRPGPW